MRNNIEELFEILNHHNKLRWLIPIFAIAIILLFIGAPFTLLDDIFSNFNYRSNKSAINNDIDNR